MNGNAPPDGLVGGDVVVVVFSDGGVWDSVEGGEVVVVAGGGAIAVVVPVVLANGSMYWLSPAEGFGPFASAPVLTASVGAEKRRQQASS